MSASPSPPDTTATSPGHHSPLEALLRACIHCGMCLPSCPTYTVTGSEAESPRGRLYLMTQWLKGRLGNPTEELKPHLDQCLACEGCQTACPSGVQYGDILSEVRHQLHQQAHAPAQNTEQASSPVGHRNLKRWLFNTVLPSPLLLNLQFSALRALQRLHMWCPLVQTTQWILHQLPALEKQLPSLSRMMVLLPTLPRSARPLKPGMSFGNPEHSTVALFLGCVMDAMYRTIHWDTIRVLVANGYHVVITRQTCCGALAHHSGEHDIARHLAQQNIASFLSEHIDHDRIDHIVVNAAGCGSTLKDYPHLFNTAETSPELLAQAKQFEHKIIDIMALLAQKPLAPFTQHRDPVFRGALTYHPPCHLHHAQGVQEEPYRVLAQAIAQLPEASLVPLEQAELCCGSAGIYNIEQPELSNEILGLKLAKIQKTGALRVLTGNPGCMMQLQYGLSQQLHMPVEVLHPVSFLAKGYPDLPE